MEVVEWKNVTRKNDISAIENHTKNLPFSTWTVLKKFENMERKLESAKDDTQDYFFKSNRMIY